MQFYLREQELKRDAWLSGKEEGNMERKLTDALALSDILPKEVIISKLGLTSAEVKVYLERLNTIC